MYEGCGVCEGREVCEGCGVCEGRGVCEGCGVCEGHGVCEGCGCVKVTHMYVSTCTYRKLREVHLTRTKTDMI